MAGYLPASRWLLLLCVGFLAVASCVGSVGSEKLGSRRSREKKSQWNEYPTRQGKSSMPLPASNNPEPLPERSRSIDPRDAWMLFMKQSNKGVNSKKQGKGKSKNFKFGLPGPPGPPGPQGPPGSLVTPEELLKDFRLLLKEVVKERERMSLKACEGCQEGEEEEERGDDILALVAGPLAKSKPQHRVEAAFHCRIRRNISIERRSLQELRIYYIPQKEGVFHRGLGLNLTSGQYTAPVAGYYTFTATLHIGDSQAVSLEVGSEFTVAWLIALLYRSQHHPRLAGYVSVGQSKELRHSYGPQLRIHHIYFILIH
ncbi:erythroferrone isoform X2 [Chelonia mydas]|uniref:erythroferrone isoform X2 n=1 Tax=Chelonia mydas TaxID=8469 RepID=UPI0018A1C342|nr:erythroferrone isoform X2 [Chelonia mydas]